MTLGRKLNQVIISLFLVAGILYIALIFFFQQQRIEVTAEKLSVFLESVAANNNDSLANELFENRPRAIILRLVSILNIQGIEQAAVFNAQGESVVDTGSSAERLTLLKDDLTPLVKHRIEDNNLVVITPIQAYDEFFGFLYLKYPLTDLQKEETRHLLFFACSILLFMLFTLVLMNAFIRKSIVSPLKRLIGVMDNVKTGSFGRQIEVVGSDEIQELSQTFNLMSEKISAGYVKIKQTRLFTEQIIDTIDSILVSVRGDNTITAWNKAAAQYTGVTKQEAVGKDVFTVFPQLEAFAGIINGAATGKRNEFIYRQCIDAVFYNIFIYSLPVGGAPGALIRLDDITEMEEKENQLRQSQKMETVGLLAGGVAHDFNNMLGGILGAAELIRMKYPHEGTGRYLDIIRDSGRRAADLVAKLMTFSRKNELETRPVDVHAAIKDAIAILKRSIDKNIHIDTALQSPRGVIDGDLTELQNSFLNLGINASHAMPDGGLLSFSTRLVEDVDIPDESASFDLVPGTYLEIKVEDTGKGIAEEHLDTIFEPFFTTKDQGKGTGLGLSAVYGTVKQLHGAVTVQSLPGKGTAFYLYFRLSGQEPSGEVQEELVLEKGRGCILLVDDEEIVRTTAEELLNALGYDVLVAKHGREAVDIFSMQHGTIDLVLLDMIMPEMNGTDCFLALRKINPDIKILFSSGYSPDAELEKLKKHDVTGFIHKPYQLKELGHVIAAVLQR